MLKISKVAKQIIIGSGGETTSLEAMLSRVFIQSKFLLRQTSVDESAKSLTHASKISPQAIHEV